jgi:hypothetical protein
MKHDPTYTSVMDSCDPLKLKKLIEKIILSQSDDQYSYATFFEQNKILVGFHQHKLLNPQYYKKFNTRVDVAKAVGITRIHKDVVLHTAKQVYKKDFEDLTTDEKVIVKDKAKERHYAYVMLQNSSPNHGKLKVGLVDDYAKGHDHFPKNRQAILHLLDKHSKTTSKSKQTFSEGHTFVTQKGGKGAKKATSKPITFDRADWTNKTCFVCGKKGHLFNIHRRDGKTEKSE